MVLSRLRQVSTRRSALSCTLLCRLTHCLHVCLCRLPVVLCAAYQVKCTAIVMNTGTTEVYDVFTSNGSLSCYYYPIGPGASQYCAIYW